MRTRTQAMAGLASLLLGVVVAASGSADAGPTRGHSSLSFVSANYHAVRSCAATPVRGHATCFAQRLVRNAGSTSLAPVPNVAQTPTNIQSAYKLTGLSASGRTVAIVDAFGYPNAARDLAIYRSNYGLPACTVANGCLRIINQAGGTAPPAFDLGWAQEQALDLDAVSATCPSCKIVLVQANDNSFVNLGKAVNRAAQQPGVSAISNSYGGGDAPDSTYGHFYNHSGIAVTASTGDFGYQGPSFPASSHYTTAVGGTTLTVASGTTRGWKETVWSGSGSGCTTLNAPPTGQTQTMTQCSGRAIADVAADADPNTGLRVYAPTSQTSSSWAQYGGTSLSAPIIASVYALSGVTGGLANRFPYAHQSALFDVTSGTNGSCSPARWCTARVGWDGPTGLGTPNGVAAF
jgi:subtilase family serine protease